MRLQEGISIAFFAAFLVASVVVRLERRRRLRAVGIGLTGILIAWSLQFLDTRPTVGLLRDMIPGLFLLMGYWQSGQFFQGGSPRLQSFLHMFDERWFTCGTRLTSSLDERRVLQTYLEGAYFMCYPLLPMGVVVLYLTDQKEVADQFWRVVLPSTFACYAVSALFQSLPPRLLDVDKGLRPPRSRLRSMNVRVLRHAGIGANTLPSGHVTSCVASSLVVLEAVPVAGALFLWTAASIAVATAVLRYHYSIDAVLGVGLAISSYVVLG